MVKIELEVSEVMARFLNEKYIKDQFGEEYTPGMVLEDAVRDALKYWAGQTLEENIEWIESEK